MSPSAASSLNIRSRRRVSAALSGAWKSVIVCGLLLGCSSWPAVGDALWFEPDESGNVAFVGEDGPLSKSDAADGDLGFFGATLATVLRPMLKENEVLQPDDEIDDDGSRVHRQRDEGQELAHGKRSPASKKILQKALWESQSWLAGSMSRTELRRMTQLFGVDDLLAVPRASGGPGTMQDALLLSGIHSGEEPDKPTPAMIADAGYPVEVHHATTEDGYILQMHRIPYGLAKGSGKGEGPKTPVYLQHGLLCSSADWIIAGPGKGLGYILADKGYDVWMGNVRGNTYSRRHETLDPKDAAFWDFSFDQHAFYDAPAQIDQISNVTGKQRMFYIGHSMGTVMFWAMSEVQPAYKERILAMFALAPVARVDHIKSPLGLLAPFVSEIKPFTDEFGVNEFMPSGRVTSWLKTLFCDPELVSSVEMCQNLLFLLCGFNPDQFNSTLLPTIVGHAPAGTSTKNVIHFAQLVNAKRFQYYDYGKAGNLEHYGSPFPPEYDLSQATAPVVTFYGDNDWLAPPEDVEWLVSKLPKLVANVRVPFDKFNHLDFIYGIDAPQVVYARILEMMPDHEEPRR